MEYIFETEHLKIRKFEIKDIKDLYENHLEEEVKKWIPNESYADLKEAQEAIKFYIDCVNEVEGSSDEVEIGYAICKKYSGNGCATELLKAMTRFITGAFGINILYGRVMHGNNASVRVLEKNGYEFVREEFGAEDDPCGNGMLVFKYQN